MAGGGRGGHGPRAEGGGGPEEGRRAGAPAARRPGAGGGGGGVLGARPFLLGRGPRPPGRAGGGGGTDLIPRSFSPGQRRSSAEPRTGAADPAPGTTGDVGVFPRPPMRRGGPKHVRRESVFFGIAARHGVVQPGAGVPPAAVGGGEGDVQAFGRLRQR